MSCLFFFSSTREFPGVEIYPFTPEITSPPQGGSILPLFLLYAPKIRNYTAAVISTATRSSKFVSSLLTSSSERGYEKDRRKTGNSKNLC